MILLAGTTALALAAPASAAPPPPAADAALDRVAETLADPARQQAMARAMGAMADVLLDLPVAPIIKPLAEAAGEDTRRIDRDATLRKLAPGAADAPRLIERDLPRAMDAVAGMSGAFATLLPQLREAAERMRAALPAERP